MGRTQSGRFVGYHNHPGEEQSQRDSLSQPYVWRYGERTRDASMVASLALNREEGKWPLSFLMSREPYVPGATTVGMVCKDGVLLASERRYAYGSFVMSKGAKKVFKITDNIGVACAGIVGDMQVLTREAQAYMSIYQYERERPGTVKNTAKLIANLLSSRRMFPFLAETIVAGVPEGETRALRVRPRRISSS